MEPSASIPTDLPPSRRKRLFIGLCVALFTAGVAFATIGAVMGALKQRFVLSNAEVGWIGGVAVGGYALAQGMALPLRAPLGLRGLLRAAWGAHLAGTLLMMAATGFWSLMAGALVIALGHGFVEAVGNPLMARLRPDNRSNDRVGALNRFHVWFPAGMAAGGAAAWGLGQAGVVAWAPGLILIPTLVYGALLLRPSFPAPAEVQTGTAWTDLLRAAVSTPVMGVLVLAVAAAALLEVGATRWLPAVLDASGQPGVLILAYIGGAMAAVRYAAPLLLRRVAPTGALALLAPVAGGGLFALTYAPALPTLLLAATAFAAGIACFWPTLLGLVAERVPQSGAAGLTLAAAVGMALAGFVAAPGLGALADDYANAHFTARQEAAVLDVLQTVTGVYPTVAVAAPDAVQDELERAYRGAQEVLGRYANTTRLPAPATANALRAVAATQAAIAPVDAPAVRAIPARAQAALLKAERYGGRAALRYPAPLGAALALLLGLLYATDRWTGRSS